MTWSFGDSFDLYTAVGDVLNGYWDSGTPATFSAGRFSGSRSIVFATNNGITKASGVNDAVHHFVVAYNQSATVSGTTPSFFIELFDGATAQCSIVFQTGGNIILTSGVTTGTVLDTYTGAFSVINTWYAFEFEVVINNTAGKWAVRKNGNTVNDHALGSLNTRVSANNYANKVQIGTAGSGSSSYTADDFFWRSDASSVTWVGDIRCIARMPASDASVLFSRVPAANAQSPVTASTTGAVTLGVARYTPFTAAYDGSIGSASVVFGTGYTGNLKAAIFSSSGTAPVTALGSANVVTNPAAGVNILTFGTPVTVTKGTAYYIGFDSDTSSGTWSVATGTTGLSSTTAYASFPAASPTTSAAAAIVCSLTITTSSNATVVNGPQQDGTTSYVYDSTVNDADFYNIGMIASVPATTIMTTTRGFMQKSDAGTRTAAVRIKSGGTTVATPTLTLSATGWLWAWRTDLTDPNTSAAWTASAVDNINIGPVVIS